MENNYIHTIKDMAIALSTDNTLMRNNLIVGADVMIYTIPSASCDRVGGFNTKVMGNTFINSSLRLGKPHECSERGARNTSIEGNVFYHDDDDGRI